MILDQEEQGSVFSQSLDQTMQDANKEYGIEMVPSLWRRSRVTRISQEDAKPVECMTKTKHVVIEKWGELIGHIPSYLVLICRTEFFD